MMQTPKQFTALDLDIATTRRRRQFIRGLVRRGLARRVLDRNQRPVQINRRTHKNAIGECTFNLYEWVD